MPPLWRVRRLKGFTQATLAQASGISKQALYEIEAGRTVPRAETIKALADALAVAPDTVDEFVQAPKRSRHGNGSEGSPPTGQRQVLPD